MGIHPFPTIPKLLPVEAPVHFHHFGFSPGLESLEEHLSRNPPLALFEDQKSFPLYILNNLAQKDLSLGVLIGRPSNIGFPSRDTNAKVSSPPAGNPEDLSLLKKGDCRRDKKDLRTHSRMIVLGADRSSEKGAGSGNLERANKEKKRRSQYHLGVFLGGKPPILSPV